MISKDSDLWGFPHSDFNQKQMVCNDFTVLVPTKMNEFLSVR